MRKGADILETVVGAGNGLYIQISFVDGSDIKLISQLEVIRHDALPGVQHLMVTLYVLGAIFPVGGRKDVAGQPKLSSTRINKTFEEE